MKLRESENIWVLAAFLGTVALLAALLLSLVSRYTAEPIRRAKENQTNAALRGLELDFDQLDGEVTINGVLFRKALKSGKTAGYIAEAANNAGYNGKIVALISFDHAGRILAVRILEHNETPGLGAVVCERKFPKTITNFWKTPPAGLPPNPMLDQFSGKECLPEIIEGEKERPSIGEWRITKDGGVFEFKTGATITSRAVVKLVNHAGKQFEAATAALNKGDAR